EHRPVEVVLEIELVHHARRGLYEVKADAELALEPTYRELVDLRARPQRPGQLAIEARLVPARREIAQRLRAIRDVPTPLPAEVAVRQVDRKELSGRVLVRQHGGRCDGRDHQGATNHFVSSASGFVPIMPSFNVAARIEVRKGLVRAAVWFLLSLGDSIDRTEPNA